ncbi:hypothetical protein E2C01_071280 [Portunus trituberculatus]|uniref:Uncharacterized protein n=1 Tax=Portunus trituberculatus TaxID=210409 RepID=A0A5B7I4K3_PORTR|nr:hypothetical protein [Portunus trituberculatus]
MRLQGGGKETGKGIGVFSEVMRVEEEEKEEEEEEEEMMEKKEEGKIIGETRRKKSKGAQGDKSRRGTM